MSWKPAFWFGGKGSRLFLPFLCVEVKLALGKVHRTRSKLVSYTIQSYLGPSRTPLSFFTTAPEHDMSELREKEKDVGHGATAARIHVQYSGQLIWQCGPAIGGPGPRNPWGNWPKRGIGRPREQPLPASGRRFRVVSLGRPPLSRSASANPSSAGALPQIPQI